jgi:hypothetical protein
MVDVVTDRFFTRRNRGEIVQNPMWREAFWMYSEPAIMTRYGVRPYNGNNIEQSHGIPSESADEALPFLLGLNSTAVVDSFLEQYDSLRDVTITKAYANVSESELLSGESLGELGETLHWIRSTMQRAITFLRWLHSPSMDLLTRNKIKQSQRKRWKKLSPDQRREVRRRTMSKKIDTSSDLWLEARYAIRPIIYEIRGILKALKHIINKGGRQTARGKYLEHQTSTTTIDCGVPADITWTEQKQSSHVCTYRAGVLYAIDNDINSFMAITGLDSPVEAVYNLTRFTFILEWFFNIGSLLDSWFINPSLHPLSSWIVEDHSFDTRITIIDGVSHNSDNATWYGTGWTPGYFNVGRRLVRRLPVERRPLKPHMRINLDYAKYLDLVTIGRHLLRRLLEKNRRK